MIQDGVIQIVLGAVAFIVWLVRLEGKVKHTEKLAEEAQKDVDVLRVRHENLDSKIVDQLTQVRESLARLEGALNIKRGE